MAKKTLKSTKLRAWKVFSEYIRKRDADRNGICTCITCGVKKHYSDMQAGHGMGGRMNSILFSPVLVNCQCKSCNIFRGGNYDEYHKVLLERHGEEGYYDLLRLKHGKDKDGKDLNVKFTIEGLEEMIEGWKEEMKGFKCQ